MKADLVVKNARIVNAWGSFDGWLAVAAGRIVAMGDGKDVPEATKVIDARSRHVLPGLIEPHSHNAIYRGFEEDMVSETRSAAAGGVTTFMTLLVHPGPYCDILPQRVADIERLAVTDVSYHACIMSPQHLDEMPRCVQSGVSSFKFLMAYRGEEGRQLGVSAVDDGSLYTGFETTQRVGYPALPMIHAENIELITELKRRSIAAGRMDLAAWTECRPRLSEAVDVAKAVSYAEAVGSRLYVVHVSSVESVDIIADAKNRGVQVIAETCPHYLTFTGNESFGVLGKVNPSLKDQESIDKLWWGIQNGVIDTMGTDHCAVSAAKKRGDGDIWSALPGFPGTATMLPVMLSEGVNKGRVSIERVAALCSTNTARAFGLAPRKGMLAVGSDADFVMVDLDEEKVVKPPMLLSAADFSLYDGWKLKGWPVMTVVRGNVVCDSGKIVAQPGFAQHVGRTPRG